MQPQLSKAKGNLLAQVTGKQMFKTEADSGMTVYLWPGDLAYLTCACYCRSKFGKIRNNSGLKGPQNLTGHVQIPHLREVQSHPRDFCNSLSWRFSRSSAPLSASAGCESPLPMSWMLSPLPQESIVPARTAFSVSLTPQSHARWQP